MNFNIAATATAAAALMLGVGWLIGGRLVLRRWGLDATPLGLLVGRRLGAAYLGIALMLFLGRSAPASELRFAVSVAMLVALTMLAVLGLIEFTARRAGKGILVSVAVEAVLAACFAATLVA